MGVANDMYLHELLIAAGSMSISENKYDLKP